jgi:hypothetical protein
MPIRAGKNMSHFSCRHLSWAALAAPVAVLTLSRAALAADAPAGKDASGTSVPVGDTPATADSSSATSAPAPAPANISVPLLGPVERLGSDAYPHDPIRGIYGGSLWSIFHGQQWPYYPKTGIGISGYVWMDTGYEHIHRGDPTPPSSTAFMLQQGRFLLRATPTWSNGAYFVQGQAELVANKDQTQDQSTNGQADVDDVWVRIGRWKSWDVQLGRYEAWEVYHFGMGLDLYTLERAGATDQALSVPAIYGVTYAFYRPGSIGNGALHVYPTKWLRFELGAQFGNEAGQNGVAARPVAIADFGFLKLKAGAEWKQLTQQQDGEKGQTTEYGAGGSAQFIIDPWVEFGVNYAYGKADIIAQDGNPDPGSYSTYSVGGFANARIADGLLIGGGLNYTYLVDKRYDPKDNGRADDFDHWQTFGAIQYHLFKQVFIKAVGAYALANLNPVTINADPLVHYNTMISGRLRVQYLF